MRFVRTLGKNKKLHTDRTMFFDGDVEIARYDVVKYPPIEKITDKQLGLFWTPPDDAILRGPNELHTHPAQAQQHVTTTLKKPTVLDYGQGSAPNLASLPVV